MYPKEKIILKFRENIPTKPIEVNFESRGIAQAEAVVFVSTDQHETTKKELLKREQETRSAIPTEPPVMTVSCYYAKEPTKRHNKCENNTINKTITHTNRTRIRSHVTNFQTRIVGPTI